MIQELHVKNNNKVAGEKTTTTTTKNAFFREGGGLSFSETLQMKKPDTLVRCVILINANIILKVKT